jgi:hypothetical protein
MAVMDKRWGWRQRGGRVPRQQYWDSLSADTLAHQGRVMISSEAFSLARDPVVDRIVGELGADRLVAVVTLRPFPALLPSSYQQYLKYGLDLAYEDWLQEVFREPPKCPPSPNFWRRNDHAGVVARWAQRLGAERVIVVVLDDRDRAGLYRTFEGLLGIADGSLVPDPAISASNRSMTLAEAETLRLVNAGGARAWDWPDYEAGVRRGAVMRMVESRQPSHDEPRLITPAWAHEAAHEVARDTAERIAGFGVRVIGDLAHLTRSASLGDPWTDPAMLPVSAAAEAVLGAALGVIAARPIVAASEPFHPDPRSVLAELRTAEVARLLGERVRRGTSRRLRRRARASA